MFAAFKTGEAERVEVGVEADDAFSRNFLLMLTWLNFFGWGMLKGSPFEVAEGAHCAPALDPDAEDWEDGLGSRDWPTTESLALGAESVYSFNSGTGLAPAAGLASWWSSFSEGCTDSVLAIDAS